MPLSKRLVLMMTAMLSFFVALGFVGAFLSWSRANSAVKEQRFGVSVEQSLRLATAFSDMETGIRGFALSGRSEFLEPYRSGRSEVLRIEGSLLANSAHFDMVTRRALTSAIGSGDSWRSFAELSITGRFAPSAGGPKT